MTSFSTLESSPSKLTPMMQQWHACKERAGSALLLFRMGDFYEAFYEDAITVAKELDLTLTKRQDIPLSGVPAHTCEIYVDKLVAKGFRVAIAEQIGDPKQTKGIVQREVVRTVTPGTAMNAGLLNENANNYIVSIAQTGSMQGIAVLDVSTAEFRVIEISDPDLLAEELYRVRPSEIVTSSRWLNKHGKLITDLRNTYGCALHLYEDWHFEHQQAHDYLSHHFKVVSLNGFGLQGMVAAINAAGGLLHYVHESLNLPIDHIISISTYQTSQYMALDRATQRNLELTDNLFDGSKKNTLLSVIDATYTPMGARLLRNRLKHPLLSSVEISLRQNNVQFFYEQAAVLQHLQRSLEHIRDLERLTMRVATSYATPRDFVALKTSLEQVPPVAYLLAQQTHLPTSLAKDTEILARCPKVAPLIAQAIVDEPPLRLNEGNVFKDGYHAELDELRSICRDSRSWITQYQNHLRETTGIKTLKVGFTRMFGYYIEVSRGQAERMPPTFNRRQTLVNAERFISPELKQFEEKVLTAEERCIALENQLFQELRQQIAAHAQELHETAKALARIDFYQSLATVAIRHHYVRPIVEDSDQLHIIGGRHPVIEANHLQTAFVSNDTLLDNSSNKLLIITGPNMAGKSTYIRQTALITILAQIGSFIPAQHAKIGIVDKIFTRIGASDDLSRGLSTFMVEMTETANILNNATPRSLVILDEIGRGTSTYDGISIAWSVAEYLLTQPSRSAKTLFATHYWELTKLEELIPGAVNLTVAVHENNGNIRFLHKIERGRGDKSYGIHVARLAGLPLEVTSRAQEILQYLENQSSAKTPFSLPVSKPKKAASRKQAPQADQAIQLTFFG